MTLRCFLESGKARFVTAECPETELSFDLDYGGLREKRSAGRIVENAAETSR